MTARCLIAAIMFAAVSAPLSAQSVEEGVEAWQQGNYAEAVAMWQPLAEGGDADAQYNLAQAYRIGRGTQPNAVESRKWFELAAKQGQVDAQTSAGAVTKLQVGPFETKASAQSACNALASACIPVMGK